MSNLGNDSENKIGSIFVFEGVDYTGKSTIAKNCYDFLEEKYPGKTVLYRSPGGDAFAESIRDVARTSDVLPETQAAIYLASLNEQVGKIKDDVVSGKNVILDRWLWSILAYQIPFIENNTVANAFETIVRTALRLNDVHMFYMDVSIETLEERISKFKKTDDTEDRFEKENEKRATILENYKRLLGCRDTTFNFKSRFVLDTTSYSLDDCKKIVLGRVIENFKV